MPVGLATLSESLGTSPLPGTHRLLGYRRLNDGSPAGTKSPPETIIRKAFASQASAARKISVLLGLRFCQVN